MKPVKLLGLDLGQKKDPSALVGYDLSPGVVNMYSLAMIRRWPLGTPYTEIVEDLRRNLSASQFVSATLCIDMTGIGRPVYEMLRAALEHQIIPVTITFGGHVTRGDDGYHVPKKDLVGVMHRLFGEQRIKIAKADANVSLLIKELDNFKVRITKALNETFQAWREGEHDDIVLAAAIGAWCGEHTPVGWDGTLGVGGRSMAAQHPAGVFNDSVGSTERDDDESLDRTRDYREPSGLRFPEW